MRVTIIPSDGFVSIDGEEYLGLALAPMPAGVHAIQWYGVDGEVEYVDEQGRAIRNERVTDITPYQAALEAWHVAKQAALEARAAEQAAEQAALEARAAEQAAEVDEDTQPPLTEG
jgi:hypothetical protein